MIGLDVNKLFLNSEMKTILQGSGRTFPTGIVIPVSSVLPQISLCTSVKIHVPVSSYHFKMEFILKSTEFFKM